MGKARTDRKNVWTWTKAAVAVIVGIISMLGSIIGVQQYRESKSTIDVTGWWKIEFIVEATTHAPYQGAAYGYKIYLQQRDREITGTGEKWWENTAELPYSQHTPITLSGTVVKRDADFLYNLKGSQRETVGSMRLDVNHNCDRMSGRFKGTAADAEGKVIAVRIQTK
jgi:hypothetical protein